MSIASTREVYKHEDHLDIRTISSWEVSSAPTFTSFRTDDLAFVELALESGFDLSPGEGVRLFSHSCMIVETVLLRLPGVSLSRAGH